MDYIEYQKHFSKKQNDLLKKFCNELKDDKTAKKFYGTSLNTALLRQGYFESQYEPEDLINLAQILARPDYVGSLQNRKGAAFYSFVKPFTTQLGDVAYQKDAIDNGRDKISNPFFSGYAVADSTILDNGIVFPLQSCSIGYKQAFGQCLDSKINLFDIQNALGVKYISAYNQPTTTAEKALGYINTYLKNAIKARNKIGLFSSKTDKSKLNLASVIATFFVANAIDFGSNDANNFIRESLSKQICNALVYVMEINEYNYDFFRSCCKMAFDEIIKGDISNKLDITVDSVAKKLEANGIKPLLNKSLEIFSGDNGILVGLCSCDPKTYFNSVLTGGLSSDDIKSLLGNVIIGSGAGTTKTKSTTTTKTTTTKKKSTPKTPTNKTEEKVDEVEVKTDETEVKVDEKSATKTPKKTAKKVNKFEVKVDETEVKVEETIPKKPAKKKAVKTVNTAEDKVDEAENKVDETEVKVDEDTTKKTKRKKVKNSTPKNCIDNCNSCRKGCCPKNKKNSNKKNKGNEDGKGM